MYRAWDQMLEQAHRFYPNIFITSYQLNYFQDVPRDNAEDGPGDGPCVLESGADV